MYFQMDINLQPDATLDCACPIWALFFMGVYVVDCKFFNMPECNNA